ncbi:hypothetical protein ACWC10_10755 [Streptomyces sp. NPDC001595]|uniref:hypothetical protein n=1 Tax=Streptomyces sp. NPDC001532 TaxID=3154520 RepID=UPI00331DAEE5
MSLHAAVVLLAALVFGMVVGGLTFLGGTPTAGAVLVGVLGGSGSVPALHTLIG